jgi:hypothetical protein
VNEVCREAKVHNKATRNKTRKRHIMYVRIMYARTLRSAATRTHASLNCMAASTLYLQRGVTHRQKTHERTASKGARLKVKRKESVGKDSTVWA